MANVGITLPTEDLVGRTLKGLAEIACGCFAERMRMDTAARLLVTVHRVLALRDAGVIRPSRPKSHQARAVAVVESIATNWSPEATTAAEFVADLPPAAIQQLLELASVWARVTEAAQVEPAKGAQAEPAKGVQVEPAKGVQVEPAKDALARPAKPVQLLEPHSKDSLNG